MTETISEKDKEILNEMCKIRMDITNQYIPKGSHILIASCYNCKKIVGAIISLTPQGIADVQRKIKVATKNGEKRIETPIVCPECGKYLTAPIFTDDERKD